jgi:hypothetical protein
MGQPPGHGHPLSSRERPGVLKGCESRSTLLEKLPSQRSQGKAALLTWIAGAVAQLYLGGVL